MLHTKEDILKHGQQKMMILQVHKLESYLLHIKVGTMAVEDSTILHRLQK